ncbi:retropepsin-like aspartic protease [Alteribacillus iranensis]|uniref:Aspartyl protease n=1 Tax=Alteribacillus iranensis TaxID=930128 RepID=A0A1I2B4C9_9BACI|nr:retropepsin-like aspartic protease [Alteribacillus iranensis]SFE51021.1 Aspartyl protease [Alteribacillus iranensis]
MIAIRELHGLPFIEASVTFRGNTIDLPLILIDTGSAGTILNVNRLEEIGVAPEPDDKVEVIYGVGGHEFVYTKPMDVITLGNGIRIDDYMIELGTMDYGMDIDGIIGYDFLKELGAIVDLDHLKLR